MRPAAAALRFRILVLANLCDRRRRNLQRRQFRARLRLGVDPFRDLGETEFIKTFRLGKEQVSQLVSELTPHLKVQQRSDAISPSNKVLIALAFYATGSFQTLVGQSFHLIVSQTIVSRAVNEVTNALNSVFHKYVTWPSDSQSRNLVKAKFYQYGIPGVIGCIDGTHVAIIRPLLNEERFYNRKGYHSLNVMIICDADLNILCVDPSNPGSTHDSMVWQNHPLSHHLAELSRNGEQMFLLGDSGYPLRETLMTPILNTAEGTPEHNYYMRHVVTRNLVERCIRLLKARFRCLLVAHTLHYSPIKAGKIVNACSVLHNIANRHRVPVIPLTAEETNAERQRQHQIEINSRAEADHSLDTQDPRNRRVNMDLRRGQALQQALVNRLWAETN